MASFKELKNKILNSDQSAKIEPKVNLIAKSDFKGQDVQVVYNIAMKLQTLIKSLNI